MSDLLSCCKKGDIEQLRQFMKRDDFYKLLSRETVRFEDPIATVIKYQHIDMIREFFNSAVNMKRYFRFACNNVNTAAVFFEKLNRGDIEAFLGYYDSPFAVACNRNDLEVAKLFLTNCKIPDIETEYVLKNSSKEIKELIYSTDNMCSRFNTLDSAQN